MFGSAFVSMLLAAGGAEEFPLKRGHRWTYVREGKEAMVMEATGTMTFGSSETLVLRVSGGPFFWPSNLHFVTSGDGGIFIHLFGPSMSSTGAPLVRYPLETGRSWDGSCGRDYISVRIRARVTGKEEVQVPAGTFQAWKIEYELTGYPWVLHDFHAWLAPGVGFVRLRFWRAGVREKKELKTPLVYELSAFEKDARPRLPAYPALGAEEAKRVQGLVKDLNNERVETREAAVKALVDLGWGVAPLLEGHRGADVEVAARVEDVLRRLPRLEAVVRSAREGMKVGEAPPVEYRLRNVSPFPIRVLPALDKSDSKRGLPKYSVEVCDERGERQPYGLMRCGSVNPLISSEVIELLPGHELDPFEYWGHIVQYWRPNRPGRYTFRLIYEVKLPSPQSAWELSPLLATVLPGRYESKVVTVTVEE